MGKGGKDEDEKIVFRKVSEAMNRDERYLALSPIPPCGRGLWHHLLFGSHITPLPGLSPIGRGAMAEELGWELADFDAAFAEIAAQGMVKADWKARVVWLPNAIRHNPPQSVNVVKGWKRFWDRVPDCALKADAHEAIKAYLKAYGEPFAKAFIEACAKPSAKPCGKADLKPDPYEKPFGEPSAKPSEDASRIQRAGSNQQKADEEPSREGRSLPGRVIELSTRTRDEAGR